MAESPASQVYSPGILGDAVLLGSGLGPLTVLRQEAASQARARNAAARLKQQQLESDARNAVPISANGWLPHTEQLKAAVQTALDANAKTYQDESLTPYQKKMEAYGRLNAVKQVEDRSNEMGKKRADIEAQAKSDSRYNKDAALTEFDNLVYGVDPLTGQKNAASQPINNVDVAKFDDILNNGKNLNKDEVLKKFVKQEADSESNRMGIAALPGGFGVTTASQSNIFAYDKFNKPIYNADGSQVIRDLPALMARAKNDPFMAKVLAQDALNLQNTAGATQMGNYEQLSPEMNARMQSLGLVGDRQMRVNLPTDLAPYGKNKTSSIQSFRPKPAEPRPREPKASDAVATSTSGFTMQNTMQPAPATITSGMKPGVAGIYDYSNPFAKQPGTALKSTTNHVPSVGYTYANGKNGFIVLNMPTNGMTTLGSDGNPNVVNTSGSNSQVPFMATGRQTVLFRNGEMIPGQGDGTGKNAREEMSRILQGAKKGGFGNEITSRVVYIGGVTDKSKVNGDGAGATSKIIGWKDDSGNSIPTSMVDEMKANGLNVQAQYDPTTTMSKAMHFATREGDAQIKAQAKRHDPSRPNAEQLSLMREVESVGGRNINPYASEASQAEPAAANTTGASYQRPSTPKPKNAAPIDHLSAAQAAFDKATAAADAANKSPNESYKLGKAAFDKVLAEKTNATNGATRGGAAYKSK